MTASGNRPAAAEPAQAAGWLDRADLLLCLSRAFLPPPPAWSVCDWAPALADDLIDLGAALGLDTAGAQAALAAECSRWAAAARRADGTADPWLVEYTRLFLMPPVRVPLNAGLYLEGSLAGSAARMIGSCYAAAGFVPAETFRDLPDHVAMQLEFVGHLFERAARGEADAAAMAEEFAAEFIDGWGEPLQRACDAAATAVPAATVYRELAALVRLAVADPARREA